MPAILTTATGLNCNAMKTQKLTHKGFKGLSNVTPYNSTNSQGVASPELAYLKSAINVDIDNAGVIVSRPGFMRIYAGKVHSLWSNGKICLFRHGDTLKQLFMHPSYSSEETPPVTQGVAPYDVRTLASGIAGNLRMSYQYIAGRVYFSDAATTGVVDFTEATIPVVRSWGIVPPNPPLLSESKGALPSGNYQVALTYQRSDGQESGASAFSSIAITRGGIDIVCPLATVGSGQSNDSLDNGIRKMNVYVTTANGEVPYLVASVDNTSKSLSTSMPGYASPLSYRGETGRGQVLSTWGLKPPPPGQLLSYYRGRLYVASHNTLWYSLPFAYELFDMAQGWMVFDLPITLVAAVNDGILVGTSEEVVFLQGVEPEKFQMRHLSSCGAVFGTQAHGLLPGSDNAGDSEVVFWESKKGKCAGLSGGKIEFLANDGYSYETGEAGAGIYWQRDGMQLYLSVMEGTPRPPVNTHRSIIVTNDADTGNYSLTMPPLSLNSY
ncbi:MAG: hypothetical protein HQL06_13710 [Nitrospirae bacterium]|nr:hypothetical protein [Nitrospirota bacterium]